MVPQRFVAKSGFSLGVWVAFQRNELRRDQLPDERKRRLDSLGFVWNSVKELWETGYKELSAYFEEHGNCLAPQSFVAKSGFSLGVWVSKQRRDFKKNKLSDERKKRLDALGFVWSIR